MYVKVFGLPSSLTEWRWDSQYDAPGELQYYNFDLGVVQISGQ